MVRRLINGAGDALALVAGAALLLMMLHIAADVLLRSVFNTSMQGTLEIVSSYYMVAVVFLPLAMVERLNAHISVELLTQHLPPRPQLLLMAAVSVLSAAYFAAFAWQTWGDAMQKYRVGEVMLGNVPITVWPTRFFVPVGCGMIVVVLMYKAVRMALGDRSVLEKAHTAELMD